VDWKLLLSNVLSYLVFLSLFSLLPFLSLVYLVCKTDKASGIMKEFAVATATLSRCGQ